jgi:RND family efflux transporter MFP subunit
MIHLKPTRILLLIALGLCLLWISACAPNRSSANPTSTPIPTPVVPTKPTYTVQRGDIVSSVLLSGRIASVTQEGLFFRVDGRIRNIYAKAGDMVKKGQILADLELLNNLERQRALSELAVRRAEIRLEMAKLQLTQLTKSPLTFIQKTYDAPLKQFEVDLAQIALDEVKLSNEGLATNVSDAQVISPIDGQLLTSAISAGDVVTGYKPLMVVVDSSKLEISADVESTLLSKLSTNLTATITAFNNPEIKTTGVVRRLPYFIETAPGTQVGDQDSTTRISMDTLPGDLGLAMGDRVNATVLLQSKQAVLWLPPQAIRSFEGRKFVIVQEGQSQRRLDIKTGIESDDRVEVLEGLDEGQVIVAP